jgi:hypothetical protein
VLVTSLGNATLPLGIRFARSFFGRPFARGTTSGAVQERDALHGSLLGSRDQYILVDGLGISNNGRMARRELLDACAHESAEGKVRFGDLIEVGAVRGKL